MPKVDDEMGEIGVKRHSSSLDVGRPSSAKRWPACWRSITSHAGSAVSIPVGHCRHAAAPLPARSSIHS
jgi:hypothetical protein